MHIQNTRWAENRMPVTTNDCLLLQQIIKEMPIAASICIDGEIAVEEIGEVCASKILACNDYFVERNEQQLFMLTDVNTIRMERFYNKTVWEQVIINECVFISAVKKLGVERWTKQCDNFYQGIIEVNTLKGKYIQTTKENFQTIFYINACLLFDKPWAYVIKPSEFFSRFSFSAYTIREPTKALADKITKAHNPNILMLTNAEIEVLLNL